MMHKLVDFGRHFISKTRKVYNLTFGRHLLLTNVTVTCGCYAGGSFVEQKLFEKETKLNYRLLAGFGGFGVFYGTVGHWWYKLLHFHPSTAGKPVFQALLYQVFLSPLEYFLFFLTIGKMQGESTETIKEEIKEKYMFTYLIDWVTYFPFTIANVRYVPMQLRLTADNFFCFNWSIILSYIKLNHIENPFIMSDID